MDITPSPLTVESFNKFGDVIEVGSADGISINDGTSQRFDDLARVDVGADGDAVISIFRANPYRSPIEIAMLERHPKGTQAFFPLSNSPWLVVVASGDEPTSNDVRVFLARGDQGIQYAKNTWHHPLLVTAESQDFLVVDRKGEDDNLEVISFAPNIRRVIVD